MTEREHRRHTMRTILWTVIFAGPFFGTVQGAAVPVLAAVAQLSDRWYGLLQAAPSLALLSQIPGVLYISSVSHRLRATYRLGVFGRCTWIVLGAIPLLLPSGPLATTAFLTLIILAWIGMHLGGLAWQSLMGDLVPARRRGRYFGVRSRIAAASNLLTSIALAFTLPSVGHPQAKWIIFVIFLVASVIGIWEVSYYRSGYEPPRKRPPMKMADLLVPFADKSFRPFLYFGFLIAFSNGIVAPFLWRHLLNGISMPSLKTTLILQTSSLVGTLLTAPLWGHWIDRHGTKAAFMFAIIGSQLATMAWPLVTLERWWIGLIIQLVGVGFWVGVDVANTNRLFAHAAKGGAGYLAIFNATIAAAGFISTAMGGEIVERLHDVRWVQEFREFHSRFGLTFSPYLVLVALCVLLRTWAVIYLGRAVERDKPTPTIAGVRAMYNQLQSGLMGLIFLPYKGVRELSRRAGLTPDEPS